MNLFKHLAVSFPPLSLLTCGLLLFSAAAAPTNATAATDTPAKKVAVNHAQSILKNGDFESPAIIGQSSDKSEYWTLYNWRGESEITITQKDARQGQSLRIVGKETTSRASVTQQNFNTDLKKGTVLRYSGFYKTKDITFGDKPILQIVCAANPHDREHITNSSIALKPSAEWTRFSREVTLKHDTSKFRLGVIMKHVKGEMMFDDIVVEPVINADELTLFSLKQPAPFIDGKLEEAAWKDAQQGYDFLKLSSSSRAPTDTIIKSTYDDEKLYLAIRVNEEHMDQITTNAKQPWAGHCVEIFIAPHDQDPWFQFVVDAAGNRAALRYQPNGSRIGDDVFDAAVTQHSDHWIVEAAIPFKLLEATMPKDNVRWEFNIARERPLTINDKRVNELSTWAQLGSFSDRGQWGRLAFYAKHEIQADLAYWDNSDRDPLMLRPVVSGYEYAHANLEKNSLPSLWDYRPFAMTITPGPTWSLRGLTDETRQKYPEFYAAAMALNHLIIRKEEINLQIAKVQRIAGYTKQDKQFPLDQIQADSYRIDLALNQTFQFYGKAFDDNRNVALLNGYDQHINQATESLDALDTQLTQLSDSYRSAAGQQPKASDLYPARVPQGQTPRNADGVSLRISNLAHEFWQNEPALLPLGDFEAHPIHSNSTFPSSKSPGDISMPAFAEAVAARKAQQISSYYLGTKLSLHDYCMPLPKWLLDQIPSDPDILLQDQDGKSDPEFQFGTNKRGVNPNNPKVQAFIDQYIGFLASEGARLGDARFLLFAQESNNYFRVNTANGRPERVVGFNKTAIAAFHEYLKERFSTVANLNKQWGSNYASFEDIQPPSDKHIKTPTAFSALRFEHERWSRVNHVQYLHGIHLASKKGAPSLSTLADPSHFFLDGNGYLLYKYDVADIISTHSVPRNDVPTWVYMQSLNKRFDKVSGYYENYWGMHRRAHLSDERLASRDSTKFFFDMWMNDVRVSGWWMRYNTNMRALTSYNGNPFHLWFDQTIYRPSTASVAPMFARGRAIENVIINTTSPTPNVAIVQPGSTIFNLASRGSTYQSSPAVVGMYDWQRDILEPMNANHEFIMEELWLDGKVDLAQYKVLVLPHAPFMNDGFAKAISDWVTQDGTLISVGPIALRNTYNQPSVVGKSLNADWQDKINANANDAWLLQSGSLELGENKIVMHKQGDGRYIVIDTSMPNITSNPQLREEIQAIIASAAQPISTSSVPQLILKERVTNDGRRFIGIANKDVKNPVNATITLTGNYSNLTDILADNCHIPAVASKGQTRFDILVAPGDWTLIDAGYAAK